MAVRFRRIDKRADTQFYKTLIYGSRHHTPTQPVSTRNRHSCESRNLSLY